MALWTSTAIALSCGLALWAAPQALPSQQTVPTPRATFEAAKSHNRALTYFKEGTRSGLRLDERQGDGLAWWPDLMFAAGTIEFDVRGKDVAQQSFVGLAFHGLDTQTFDAIYFRPFNFKSTDAARRAHGVQYISHPAFPWEKLRADRPGQFEKEVSPPPDPNDWFHVAVVVQHPRVRVFVNGLKTPSLEVNQLSDRKRGWVGFWVGNGSGGSFANLSVGPVQ
jgi:hypothetical protein